MTRRNASTSLLTVNTHSLQGVLQQLLDMGVVGGLPEDLQWTIRMLLPKPPPCAPPVAAVTRQIHHVAWHRIVSSRFMSARHVWGSAFQRR